MQHGAGETEDGCAHGDAIEIVGKALGEDESLASTGGAALEIRFRGRGSVVRAQHKFGGLGGGVQRAEGPVAEFLAIGGGSPPRLAGVWVARVGWGRGRTPFS